MTFPLNEYEREKKRLTKNPEGEEIELTNFAEYEETDRLSFEATFKKYNKLWRFIFSQYANSLKGLDKGINFEEVKDQIERISRQEFWKFMKDYKLSFLSDLGKVSTLFRLVNLNILGEKGELNYLN